MKKKQFLYLENVWAYVILSLCGTNRTNRSKLLIFILCSNLQDHFDCSVVPEISGSCENREIRGGFLGLSSKQKEKFELKLKIMINLTS